jgi:hypothetical protein
MGFYPWQWYCNKIQHTKMHISHKIAHHAQTKHTTQSYTNNKGHITHSQFLTALVMGALKMERTD